MDLDKLKSDAMAYVAEHKLTVFPGVSRMTSGERIVIWDSKQEPDVKKFIDAAISVGAKIVVVHTRQLDNESLQDVLEELEDSAVDRAVRRELEKRVKALRPYLGFTSILELSFDLGEAIYVFEEHSDFMNELLSVMEEIDMSFVPEEAGGPLDEDDDNTPPRGFFSRN